MTYLKNLLTVNDDVCVMREINRKKAKVITSDDESLKNKELLTYNNNSSSDHVAGGCPPPMILDININYNYNGSSEYEDIGKICLPNGCCLPLLSYLLLPNKRDHSGITVLFFHTSLLVFLGIISIHTKSNKDAMCHDDVTRSTIVNDPVFCGLQGISKQIDYEFGPACMLYWISSRAIITSTFPFKPSNNKRMRAQDLLTVLKMQWRVLMLAVIYLLAFILYQLFIVLEASKLDALKSPIDERPEWISKWFDCIVDGNGQDVCSQYSIPNIPSINTYVMAEGVIASLGILMFIIFGTSKNLWMEWKDLLTKGFNFKKSDVMSFYDTEHSQHEES
ncbi:4686_t:CDS:2 [Entrophospora sp. SA101]|nr:4686_t:CDS:2 [Entrophospora sp. SA101]